MYVPPNSSPYYKVSQYFNARIGEWDWPAVTDDYYRPDQSDETKIRSSQDKVVNQFGKSLIDFFSMFHCLPLNGAHSGDLDGKFTFVDSQGNSVIDYVIVSEDLIDQCEMHFEVGSRVESAHMPIELSVRLPNSQAHTQKMPPAQKESFTKFKWDGEKANTFSTLLNSEESSAQLHEAMDLIDTNIDQAVSKFNETILKASECMKKTIRVKNDDKQSSNKWYDRDCIAKKKDARKALRSFQNTSSHENKQKYNATRKEYKETIREKKKVYKTKIHQSLSDSKHNSQKFWETVRNARQKKRNQPDIDIKEWQNHFEKVFKSDTVDEPAANPTQVVDDVNAENYNQSIPLLDNPITENEVKAALKNLKAGKAEGLDGICGELLKHASSAIVPFLTKLFNKMFNMGYFPALWSQSVIFPLHKKGDTRNPDNYRGISLLCIASKVFTFVLNKRLYSWAESAEKISTEQAGFRKGFSTVDHIFTLTSIVKKRLYSERGGKVYAAFIDYKKAFDTVDRQKLRSILQEIEISSKMLSMLKAIYFSVESCVRWGAKLSEFFGCPQGVKQGCLLSPLIFSLLISKVADEVRKHGKHGFQLLPGNPEIFLLLFADDIVLLSSTPAGLQHQINNLERASKDLNLEVNLDKTKIMVFRKGGHLSAVERWSFSGQNVEVVNSYKYLGFLLTTKLSADCACEDSVGRAKGKVLDLMKTMWSLGYFDPSFFFQLFDAQVKSMLLYAAEIWGTLRLSIIESAHTFACKRLLGLSDKTPNHLVYGDTGRYPLYIDSCIASVRYWLKLENMSNDRIPKQAFLMLKNCIENNMFVNNKNWAWNIKTVLESHGFENAWRDGVGNPRGFLRLLRTKMIENFKLEWARKLDGSERFLVYKTFKQMHGLESYLSDITIKRFRDCVIRLRFGINDLNVNRRYQKATRPVSPNCPFCPGKNEDEIHFLLHCPKYASLRTKYLKDIICKNVADNTNFHELLCCRTVANSRSLGMFVFYAFKLREELLL
jgi:hypothetical protein